MATISSGRQIKAARVLLGWSQRDLAGAAGLHINTVKAWEVRQGSGGAGVAAMVEALQGQGVRFISGGAVIEGAAV